MVAAKKDLKETLETTLRLTERAKQRRAAKEEAAARAQETEPVQLLLLPLLQQDERGMPNALARGALFNAAKSGGHRTYYQNRIVASLSNLKVEYQGQELRQDDCSVFIALLYFQQETPLGDPIYFTAYEMLRELGWSINTFEYKHLRECCVRLSATNLSIDFSDKSQGFAGSLLRNFAWKDEGGILMSKWCVQFEPAIARFFQEDSFSILDPLIRRKISGRAPLAQWLHNFLNSHHDPYAMSVAKYCELTDSSSKCLSDFRSRLRVALQRLVDSGFLVSWEIKNDLVHVTRVRVTRAKPIYRTFQIAKDAVR